MKRKLTKIQESIFVLCTLQALLDEYIKCLTKEKDNSNSVIYSIITSQIIITSCSYLDEWEELGKLTKVENEPKIITLRKTVKPAIDRINQWSDMRQFRNNIIAHNHRIKNENNSLSILYLSRNLNCPATYFDYKLLLGCIYITKNVLLRFFKDEYNLLIPNIKDIEDLSPINEVKNEKSFRKEFDEIVLNVESLIETKI
jgi:hypothetical protein